MNTQARITDVLRAEHRDLLPRVDELRLLAADSAPWSAEMPSRLGDAVTFLREHLVPHARAEEVVLYPAVEVTMDSPHATDTMVRDHVEIAARVDRLGALIAAVATGPPDSAQIEELKEQLYGMHAILRLHFAKEEEVLLSVLDAQMTREQADAIFADMVEAAHPR